MKSVPESVSDGNTLTAITQVGVIAENPKQSAGWFCNSLEIQIRRYVPNKVKISVNQAEPVSLAAADSQQVKK